MGAAAIGAGVAGAGSLLGAFGQYQAQNAQNKKQAYVQNAAQGMFQNSSSPFEIALQNLLNGRQAPTAIAGDTGAIDINSILGNVNPGNDALSQMLRSDPLSSTTTARLSQMMNNPAQFNASQAFAGLQAQDQLTTKNALTNLLGSFGGLGQRFGTSAQNQAGNTLANISAQLDARNAGIAQSSFSDAQARALQAANLLSGREQFSAANRLNAAQSLNQNSLSAAQLAAGLAQANQGNLFQNEQFNQNNLNNYFAQQLSGLNTGFGMQQARNAQNAQLLGIIQGLPQMGNAATAFGGGLGDIGQLIAFLPFLQNFGKGGNG